MADYGMMCPVFRPTREEFELPFCEYVRKIFRKHPDLPMFKVVPPRGWKPRRTPFPDLRKVQINVPIRQHVFGTKGAYRCLFMEQKPMSVAEFKLAAEEETQRLRGGHGRDGEGQVAAGVRASTRTTSARLNRPPPNPEHVLGTAQRAPTGAEGDATDSAQQPQQQPADPDAVDADMERSFWANVTLNPPMYGADTPTSFFDEKLPYGWNLRHLGDLLQNHPKVDSVPGVTTPMTYFGMWRSFFGWHKEDADLYSVNFLHWGAPKVWYGVAPSARQKFERMAQSLFPDLHRTCPAFVRHKDIMLSPSSLKTYGVPYMRACQRPNEFVVLNAAAYHAGFNSGFNCAEAVNFGMKEWIPVGKAAVPCRCSALRDGVRISMKLFDPKWVDPYETPSESSSDSSSEEEASSSEEEEAPAKRRRGRGGKAAAAPAKRGRPRKKASEEPEESSEEEEDEEAAEEEEEQEEEEEEKPEADAKPRRKRTITKKAAAAAEEAKAADARRRARSRTPTRPAGREKSSEGRKKAAAAEVVKKAASRSRAGVAAPSKKATAATATSPAARKGAPARAAAKVGTAGGARKPAAQAAAGKAAAGQAGRKRKGAEDEDAEAPSKASEPQEQEVNKGSRGLRGSGPAAAKCDDAVASSPPAKRARNCVEVMDLTSEGTAEGAVAAAEGTAAAGGRPVRSSARRAGPGRGSPQSPAAPQAAEGKPEDDADTVEATKAVGARGRGARAAARAAAAAAAEAAAAAVAAGTGTEGAGTRPAETHAAPGVAPDGRPLVTAVKPRSTVAAAAMALKAHAHAGSQEAVVGPPMAIVGDSTAASGRRPAAAAGARGAAASLNKRFFFLVQRLDRPAPTPGNVLLRWLKEGRDGLFRPVAGSVWEEPAGALVPVHALAVCSGASAGGGSNNESTLTPAGVLTGDALSDGEHGGSSAASSSTSAAGAGAGAGAVSGGAAAAEPEAWRLVTPRDQIVDVVLRRE